MIQEAVMRYGVIFLPGIITPAADAYGALVDQLGFADVRPTELAVYNDEEPAPGYGMADEFASLEKTAADAGFERFHLVGYSGGGAISAAYAAEHPDRLVSLTLMEAAWLGNEGMSETVRRVRDLIVAAAGIAEFTKLQLAPGVSPAPPPSGDPPPWMAKRPAGIAAINRVFSTSEIAPDALRAFVKPTLYMLGSESNPDFRGEIAERARTLFPNFTLEVFAGRHHFDPPHRAEPQRVADLLREFWMNAEASVSD
jgi:pimeloyl-ACP methyl ester carboxylesterase